MRKRASRRRIKARARLGRKIPWSQIVDCGLEKWGEWERQHDTMTAYQIHQRRYGAEMFVHSSTVYYPMSFVFATGSVDFLHNDVVDRRFWPIS